MKSAFYRRLCAYVLHVVVVLTAAPGLADELSLLKAEIRALRRTVGDLQATVQKQQTTIDSLVSLKAASNVGDRSTEPSTPSSPTGASRSPAPFIPDIGVVADITAASTQSKDDEEGNDRLSVREVEIVLGHDIDPYSRFDATFTFSDYENPGVEEAYVSYWDLPWSMKGKIGRFRPKIGKASAAHRDSLDTADEPLVIQRYFGAEGLFRSGLEFSGFTSLSADSFTQQLTGGIVEGGTGEGGDIFGDSQRSPTIYGHLSHFVEINDDSNFELGGTYLLGSSRSNSEFKTQVFGIDATYIDFLTVRNKFKWQSEVYLQNRDDPQDPAPATPSQSPWGAYSLIDFRLDEHWGVGARYDRVGLIEHPIDGNREHERAFTGYLTFFQSEFARWRFQYQRALLASGLDDNRFFLQGTFAIGTHKHQLQ